MRATELDLVAPLRALGRDRERSRRSPLANGALLVCLLASLPSLAPAQTIEKWRTREGKLHFGENPPPGSEKIGESGWQREDGSHSEVEAPSSIVPRATDQGPSHRPYDLGTTHVGRVVDVSDGDTITLVVGGREVIIRLAEIDAPERGEPHGNSAKQAVERLVLDKQARVTVIDVDHYGRIVGKVSVNGRNVNAALVEEGHARVYRRYARDQTLFALEDEARLARRGLWAETGNLRRDDRGGAVVGNRRSRIYHWPECPSYGDVSSQNRVVFETRAAAESAGYRAARNCP